MDELAGPSLIRLTTLEVRTAYRRPPGRRRRRQGWLVFARNEPSSDPNHGFVDVASEIPPIEATEGTEVRLTVRWVAPPPAELEGDDQALDVDEDRPSRLE